MPISQNPKRSTFRMRFSGWAANELHPMQVVRSLVTGGLLYVLSFIFAISFAVLIFSDGLTGQLPAAVGLIVLGSAVMVAFVALFSSYAGAFARVQETPVAILAITAAALLETMPAGTTVTQAFSSTVMMIVLTTLLTGLFFVLLGFFKLGGLVRYLPYPVMGGFLAATGWILLSGGIRVMVVDASASGPALFRPETVVHWLPGLLLGFVLVLVSERTRNGIALPAVISVAFFLFYLIVWLIEVPIEQLSAEGWVLGDFPSGSLWQFPLNQVTLAQTNWAALAGQAVQLAPIMVISAIALLLNANGIELVHKRDIDLNHELMIAGFGNLIGGLLGSVVSVHSLVLTTLNHTVSKGKRLPGLFTALLLGLSAFLGASILAYVPRLILGGLLTMLGLALLLDWVYRAWFAFPRVEFVIILLIVAITASRGFLEGVAVGLVAAIILFVVRYSRTSVVRHALSGTAIRGKGCPPHSGRGCAARLSVTSCK